VKDVHRGDAGELGVAIREAGRIQSQEADTLANTRKVRHRNGEFTILGTYIDRRDVLVVSGECDRADPCPRTRDGIDDAPRLVQEAPEGRSGDAHSLSGRLVVEPLDVRQAEGFHLVQPESDLLEVAAGNARGIECAHARSATL
jgi:hypothetical protein